MQNRGSWAPGRSGNAAGAPKRANALARQIREKTKNGAELIAFMLEVLAGGHGAELTDRVDSVKWLADRGWGKAVETIELIEDASAGPVDTLAPELLAAQLGPNGAQA